MSESKKNCAIIVWTTIIGGFMSSLVKWGSEVNMPPRAPGEISPPGAHIDAWLGWLGFNQHSLDYIYQGNSVLGAVTLYHWLFSFAFAFVYVVVSYYWNNIRMWYGALYGIIITVVMHGFLIPLLGFRNPVYANGATGWLWNLNGYELWSEILGHIYWSVSIEICMIAVLAYFGRPIHVICKKTTA
jgi:putative membrane protein